MTGRVTSGRELTDVELQVVQWLPMPLSFTDIGHRLGMRGPAVRALAVALYRRLGVASRHDAVQRCIQLGLVPPDLQGDDRNAVEAERDLRSSLEDLDEAFFQMAAVRDPSGHIVDFRYEYCNRAGLVVLGRHRDDVFGQRLLELFPSHRSDGLFDAFVQVAETGAPLRYEFSFDDGGVVGEFEVLVSRHGDGY